MIRPIRLTKAEVVAFWGMLSLHYQRALDKANGEMDLFDLRARLVGPESDMWAVAVLDPDERPRRLTAAFAVQVVSYPRYKALRVSLGAGDDMEAWIEPVLKYLEEGARNIQARQIELCGRPGFERKLRDKGYVHHVFMVRRLDNEH